MTVGVTAGVAVELGLGADVGVSVGRGVAVEVPVAVAPVAGVPVGVLVRRDADVGVAVGVGVGPGVGLQRAAKKAMRLARPATNCRRLMGLFSASALSIECSPVFATRTSPAASQ